jgi:hypothetical protein
MLLEKHTTLMKSLHLVYVSVFATLVLLSFNASTTHAQDVTADDTSAKAPFSQLVVKPTSLQFKKLNLPTTQSETRQFTISDNGTLPLSVTVGTPTGTAASSYSIVSGGGTMVLAPHGTPATVIVKFQPPTAVKSAPATIAVSSNATKPPSSKTVKLSGSSKGVAPTPVATATPSATPTMAATSTATIASTPTSSATATTSGTTGATPTGTGTPAATPTGTGTPVATGTPSGVSPYAPLLE